jgi:hypothetical protein
MGSNLGRVIDYALYYFLQATPEILALTYYT